LIVANPKKSMFVLADGTNVLVTFLLVSSLFLLWRFCNGMIDVMDKHFQTELQLTLAQSCNGIGWIFGPLAGAVVAAYGYLWPLLRKSESLQGVKTTGGH